MAQPAREELKQLADRVFQLQYQGREVMLKRRIGRRGKRIYGIAYIPDLRPRNEREPQDDGVPDLDEVGTSAA